MPQASVKTERFATAHFSLNFKISQREVLSKHLIYLHIFS